MAIMRKDFIFISIDGLTDQLGQSQVLPYLCGLASEYKITVISLEKGQRLDAAYTAIKGITGNAGINWVYTLYGRKWPVLSQWLNMKRLKRQVSACLIKSDNRVVFHCRSYMPALIALNFKKKKYIPYIFDMRGFWADERIDGHIWKLKNPVHYLLYRYFKKKEKELIAHADHVVTLTAAAKKEIISWQLPALPPVSVIPCCADTGHFIIHTNKDKLRQDLDLPLNKIILGYLGSLGTWYMAEEMLDFFNVFQKRYSHSAFLFITNDNGEEIKRMAVSKGISANDVIVRAASRNEVPLYINCFHISIFFIRPLFSKKGSSPTKLAEILACGIPVISNSGVGDIDEIFQTEQCGLLTHGFNDEEYQRICGLIPQLLEIPAEKLRSVSLSRFSLGQGTESYRKIYESLS